MKMTGVEGKKKWKLCWKREEYDKTQRMFRPSVKQLLQHIERFQHREVR